METLLKGGKNLLVLLASVLLLGACQEGVTVGPDDTVPPPLVTSNFIDIPGYVGTVPTPYDGTWEGDLIIDYKKCLPRPQAYGLLQTYSRLIFKISMGTFRSIEMAAGIKNANGFVNKRGVYVARSGIGEMTFAGKITGDRLNGEWHSWGSILCGGQVDLIRKTGNRYYCLDRLSGRPYSGPSECNGIDKLLTKAEFDARQPAPAPK